MSKSRGNVVDPDEQIHTFGADTVRAYLVFGYRWSEGGAWNPENIQGVVRWLNRVWSLVLETAGAQPGKPEASTLRGLNRKLHQTIRQTSSDLDRFEFNTVVSSLMELTNAIQSAREAGLAGQEEFKQAVEALLLMMAPITPHIAEELWARLGRPYSIHNQAWPTYDPELAQEEEVVLVVQVNGKVRDRIRVPLGIDDEKARALALASDVVQRYLAGRQPRQVIVVPGRLVNVVL